VLAAQARRHGNHLRWRGEARRSRHAGRKALAQKTDDAIALVLTMPPIAFVLEISLALPHLLGAPSRVAGRNLAVWRLNE
jgi:hypothetical protein